MKEINDQISNLKQTLKDLEERRKQLRDTQEEHRADREALAFQAFGLKNEKAEKQRSELADQSARLAIDLEDVEAAIKSTERQLVDLHRDLEEAIKKDARDKGKKEAQKALKQSEEIEKTIDLLVEQIGTLDASGLKLQGFTVDAELPGNPLQNIRKSVGYYLAYRLAGMTDLPRPGNVWRKPFPDTTRNVLAQFLGEKAAKVESPWDQFSEKKAKAS